VIFHDYERVATHRWGPRGTRRTILDHDPPDKLAHLMATPSWCRAQAVAVDPHGVDRLEAACRRAPAFDELGYRTVKRILEQRLERHSVRTLRVRDLPLKGVEPWT